MAQQQQQQQQRHQQRQHTIAISKKPKVTPSDEQLEELIDLSELGLQQQQQLAVVYEQLREVIALCRLQHQQH
jgi:hypothetical protein